MSKNLVVVRVQFKNLPDSSSDEYSKLINAIKIDDSELKHSILTKPAVNSEYDYYKVHSDFYRLLSKNIFEYSKEVPASSVSYDLYEAFSKQYNVDLDVQVSKTGKYCDECLDRSSVNYYNHLRTLITNGHLISQSFSHIDANGRLADASIDFKNNECQHAMKALYPLLTSRLDEMKLNERYVPELVTSAENDRDLTI